MESVFKDKRNEYRPIINEVYQRVILSVNASRSIPLSDESVTLVWEGYLLCRLHCRPFRNKRVYVLICRLLFKTFSYCRYLCFLYATKFKYLMLFGNQRFLFGIYTARDIRLS